MIQKQLKNFKKNNRRMKMIKWLYKKFREVDREESKCRAESVSLNEVHNEFSDFGMNINITAATGGKIVEFRKRKRNTTNSNKYEDEIRIELYIITEEENFVESFSKITSMELMR